ncbi:MBL fold metallo-hydrolase [Actinocrinis sp.]|uniref:MBL fold metallo-hydrolase n=1 Tax=Actinocrinis sp. TaxID=1920516 RepID=UPI002DDD70CF|nr:MBL fold metallo-hydrolase [Actinocrinis sp.]
MLAPNPSPMTLDGTNTWVLIEPGSAEAVVVDPGPRHEGHLAAVLERVAAVGARVASILLTHGHPDHAEAARRFAELTRAPVRALDPMQRLGSEGLGDGDAFTVGGLEIRVVATPGHTGDSLSFLLPADRALLTGDTVLGRGTTLVAHPDGKLAEYLDSLTRIRQMADSGAVSVVLPGHGPIVAEPGVAVEFYLKHRAARLAQVEAALAAGDRTAREIVRRVYADVDPGLWPAAELSVLAQLEYLDAKSSG